MKEYREDNRDTTLTYQTQYRENKKEIRKCVCGSEYNCGNSGDRNKHYSSNKHTEFVETFYNNLRELMCQ